MHVLVADDDTATRFVIKRILTQQLGFRVSECADGIEALQLLEGNDVDLLILDIQMPVLDGLEVLEAMRRSSQWQSLPVVVLTVERHEETVMRLIRLGILGYVLKPLRSERLLPLIEQARKMVKRRERPASAQAGSNIRLSPETPALLIDGNIDYRHFFETQSGRHGPVMIAESGLSGLSAFRRAPVSLVFIGDELGVIDAALLTRKLRELAEAGPLRLVAVNGGEAADPPDGFDEAMQRTFVPAVHAKELRRFVDLSGPLDNLCGIVGDISAALASATAQVFGMMLDCDVQCEEIGDYSSDLSATIEMGIKEQFKMAVETHASSADARAISARMLMSEPDTIGDEDMRGVIQELVNLLTGRLRAGYEEKGIANTCTLPNVQSIAPPAPLQVPHERHGFRIGFSIPAVSARFAVIVRVEPCSVTQSKSEESAA